MVSSDPMQVSVALNPGQKVCTSDQKVWFIISLLAGDVHQNIDQLEIFFLEYWPYANCKFRKMDPVGRWKQWS